MILSILMHSNEMTETVLLSKIAASVLSVSNHIKWLLLTDMWSALTPSSCPFFQFCVWYIVKYHVTQIAPESIRHHLIKPLEFASNFQKRNGCECGAINYTKSKHIPGSRKKIEWNQSMKVRRREWVEEEMKTVMLFILSSTNVEISSFASHFKEKKYQV